MTRTIAVTGATGRVGARVVDVLVGADAQVVALGRRTRPASLSRFVEYRRADYRDRPRMRTVLRGVDSLVMVSADGEAGTVLDAHSSVLDAVRANHVGHVVLLSSLDADPLSPFCYAHTAATTERWLADLDIRWAAVRASIFAEFLANWATTSNDGHVRVPAGDARIAVVARTDVAAVLARCADDEVEGVLDVTGPEALTMEDITRRVAARDDLDLVYVDIDSDQHRRDMVDAGESPWWSYAYWGMFASIREERWSTVTSTVADILGRPAQAFPGPSRADEEEQVGVAG